MVEHNIAECIKNNVLGTLVMVKVAIERQVERFILVVLIRQLTLLMPWALANVAVN